MRGGSRRCVGCGFRRRAPPRTRSARRAEAALHHVVLDERVHHRVLAQALDRRHLALDPVHERDAREHRHAVDEHGAGPAMPLVAGDLRAGQAQIGRAAPPRASARRGVDLVAAAVDRELSTHGHRQDVGQVDQPRDDARAADALAFLVVATASSRAVCAVSSSSRICSVSSSEPFDGESHALSARPSTPIESGWRVHISGVAIERYWWMRAMIVGCVNSSPPFGDVG